LARSIVSNGLLVRIRVGGRVQVSNQTVEASVLGEDVVNLTLERVSVIRRRFRSVRNEFRSIRNDSGLRWLGMLVQLVRGAIFFALCRQSRRSLAEREGVLVEFDVSRAQTTRLAGSKSR